MRITATARQRGFTLGETLAALAVAGIGLAMAVPGLQALTHRNSQAVAVNQLVATMHLARSEAVMRNARVSVCASADGASCDGRPWSEGWIAFVDADGDLSRSDSETLLDRVPAPGMSLTSPQFTNAFTYAADGRPAGSTPEVNSGEFAFCEAGAGIAGRVVILRANGLPTLADHGRDGAPVHCPATPES